MLFLRFTIFPYTAIPPPLSTDVPSEVNRSWFTVNSDSNQYIVEIGREFQVLCVSYGEYSGSVTWFKVGESRMIMIAHRTRKAQAKQMFKNLKDILNVSINYIKCKPFTYWFAPAVYANDYNESVWGCRLFHSLKLFHHDFNGEYTADHKTCIKYLQLTLMSLYMHTFSGGLPILRYQENNLHF